MIEFNELCDYCDETIDDCQCQYCDECDRNIDYNMCECD